LKTVSETGDRSRDEEFERLVLGHRPRMIRTVWRVVRDPDLAEEALQEALETLWRKLDALRSHPNPEAFVLRVCLDSAHDQLRERIRSRSRIASLEEAEGEAGSAEERASVREVLAAVRRLNRRQAVAILLHAVHGEPYRAVAEALGCSEPTARVHVQRAREKLRREFARRGATKPREEST
jgi:RNA polymerase sigma-70 factor (ECF subfamily)